MEHLQHGMKRKWERHFRETNTNISVAMMVLGASFLVSLLYVYPQRFSKIIFDSRLAFNLMVDVEDYWTGTKQYDAFVVDEPTADIKLFAFYVFNVTNTLTVIQRGFKPVMVELGPYGYMMHSYKYDVLFEPEGSTSVSFKEYNLLKKAPTKACERMFFRMDKDLLVEGNPCLTRDCTCQDTSDIVTIINPLYSKVLKEETSNSMISQYAIEIFATMKDLLENDFVEAVKAHLVPTALEEILIIRRRMQTQTLLNISFEYMKKTLTDAQMIQYFLASNTEYTAPSTCGLYEAFGVPECRWNAGESLRQVRVDIPSSASYFKNVTDADIPYDAVPYLLNPSNDISFHHTVGLLNWIAISVYLGYQDIPFVRGSAMTDTAEMKAIFEEVKAKIVAYAFPTSPTNTQKLGSEMLVSIVCHYLSVRHITFYSSALTTLVYEEWYSTSEPVLCSFTYFECVWQWGAIAHLNNYEMSTKMKFSWIDRGAKVNTNPLSLYYDGNSAMMYNTFRYCRDVVLAEEALLSCIDISFAQEDCEVNFPAAIAGMAAGFNQLDTAGIMSNYLGLGAEEQMYWTLFGCNMSFLVHDVYRNSTGFHDEFVIRFINKYKLESFTHTFTVGKWEELGHAQWGGGFVTQALLSVYSIYNIKRNGMWYFGQKDYYDGLLEFNSWAVRSGYPDAKITNVTESRILLETLSSREPSSVELRRFIMYQTTTLVGDGTNTDNGVGDVGEIAFTNENNIADYSCAGVGGDVEVACEILSAFVNSSSAQCLYIDETIYLTCTDRIRKNDQWVTNCDRFETSMTSPLQGIQCDTEFVYGRTHPYLKSKGLVLAKMMFGLVIEIVLKLGLWCPNYDNCKFDRSGLFTTIPVQKLLFDGFADASVLKYLDSKYTLQGVTFECVNEPHDDCGTRSFFCDSNGIKMDVGNESLVLKYGATPKEQYFVERFFIHEGRLIWPFDKNDTVSQKARAVIAADTDGSSVFTVINPFFALFPAWESGDQDFLQFYQCQGRYLFGPAELFNSCTTAVQTGTDQFSKLKQLIYFRGNTTVNVIGAGFNTSGTIDLQLAAYRWDGFSIYPYQADGRKTGRDFEKLEKPVVFNRLQTLRLELNQDLLEPFDRVMTVTTPFQWAFEVNGSASMGLPARRFLESEDSWLPYHDMGKPEDSFGMPYTIPNGMSSLNTLAGFPLFIGTPHNYGNEEWGGKEYLHVVGMEPDRQMHKTFVDYDAVTGKMLRVASRQQVNMRIERTSLHTILFSSQKRCISPTKTFTDSTGYGCFAYVPLFWMEESRTISDTEFRDLFVHYYTRPARAEFLGRLGTIVGATLFVIGAIVYQMEKRKREAFRKRIYID